MNPMLNTAIKAAHEAGDIILDSANKIDQLTIQQKGVNDFVSEVDKMAEEQIIFLLKDSDFFSKSRCPRFLICKGCC